MTGPVLFLTFVIVQRLVELAIARRNTARLLSRGAVEHGAAHYPAIVVLNEPLVSRGPFRIIPHPNYAVVIAEIAVTPMVLGLTWVAILFTVLNAALLFGVRIPAENRALAQYRT